MPNGRHTYRMTATQLGALTRDMRADMFANTDYVVGKLPAPLYYQPDNKGHDDGHLVGAVESMSIDAAAGTVDAAGYFMDGPNDPDRIRVWAAEAIDVARQRLVNPSIDAGVLEVDAEAGQLARADISGVSLVGMPAMTGTSITIIDPDDVDDDEMPEDPIPREAAPGPDDVALIAAARTTGWDELPLAARDREWDGDAAAARLAEACDLDAEGDGGAAAWDCYAAGFLYRDEAAADTRAGYKLGIVDLDDGERVIVPAAVFAVASVLQGGRGGADIPEGEQDTIRGTVAGLYRRMAAEFDDEALVAPWEGEQDTDTTDPADGDSLLSFAMVAAVTEPAPAAAFEPPDRSGYDPGYRIEGRRITGHLASANACHASWINECMGPPPTATGYGLFARYRLATDAGPIAVGRLTSGFGRGDNGCQCCDPAELDDHACPWKLDLSATIAYHDQLTALADVTIGEAEDGTIWLSGLLRENLPDDAARVLARRVWSGDWRPAGASDELVEVLALDHRPPAFTRRVRQDMHRTVVIAAAGPAPVDAAPAALDAAQVTQIANRTWEARTAGEQLTAALAVADQAAARADLYTITGKAI